MTVPRNIQWSPQIVLPSLAILPIADFDTLSRAFKLSVFSMQCEHLISPDQFVFCLLSNSVMAPRICP